MRSRINYFKEGPDLELINQAYSMVMDAVAEVMDKRKTFEEEIIENLIDNPFQDAVMVEPPELSIIIAAREKCMRDFISICKGEIQLTSAKDEDSFWKMLRYEPEPEDKQRVLEAFNQEYRNLENAVISIINNQES